MSLDWYNLIQEAQSFTIMIPRPRQILNRQGKRNSVFRRKRKAFPQERAFKWGKVTLECLAYCRKASVDIGAILLIVLLIFISSREVIKDSIYVDTFECSKSIIDLGYSNNIVTSMFMMNINSIKYTAKSTMKSKYFSTQSSDKVFEVKIPNSDISLASLVNSIKTVIGHIPPRVSGNVVSAKNGKVSLLISANGKYQVFEGDSVESALKLGAEYAYQQLDPYIYAAYIYRVDRSQLLPAIRNVLCRPPLKDHAWAFYLWGMYLVDQKDFKGGLSKFTEAIRLDSKFPNPYYGIGYILRKYGDTPNGRIYYLKALELDKNFVEAIAGLGSILEEEGRDDDALAQYHCALTLSPEMAWAYKAIGKIMQKRGDYTSAIANYELALYLKPDFVEALTEYGDALKMSGDFRGAQSKYDLADEAKKKGR
jgi:Flp pilus assembly protein TadD